MLLTERYEVNECASEAITIDAANFYGLKRDWEYKFYILHTNTHFMEKQNSRTPFFPNNNLFSFFFYV